MCSKWSMLAEGDDWSFISYTLSCIMHEIQDVLGLPRDLAVMYCITMPSTHSEFLVTVSVSLSKWEPGTLQNSRVPDSGMMDFWSPSKAFHRHTHDSGKVSERLQALVSPNTKQDWRCWLLSEYQIKYQKDGNLWKNQKWGRWLKRKMNRVYFSQ